MKVIQSLLRVMLAGIWTAAAGLAWNSRAEQTARQAAKNLSDAATTLKAEALTPAPDPVRDDILAFGKTAREAFDQRRFDWLEEQAKQWRGTKAQFGNGDWKIAHLYQGLNLDEKTPEETWLEHGRIYTEWMAAKPESITARVAYAWYLNRYAWHARGSGWAKTVNEDGWQLMKERQAKAHAVLQTARAWPETDPCWWLAELAVALGQGWDKPVYDQLVAEAHAFEPRFFQFDLYRAYSLLPRWHGEPGDWEAFALETSRRPDSAGSELYARIVIHLQDYYSNIFKETQASWPRTKRGLQQLRQRYPDAIWFVAHSAMLACLASDRELAKEMFDRLGNRYVGGIWPDRTLFVRFKSWAETGKW